jgi:simple sugar transport system substrate-binding protein/basic membrane protein A
MKKLAPIALLATTGLLALTACSDDGNASDGSTPNGADDITVGVVMVGSVKDAGYNEAVAVAAEELDKVNGVTVLTADQIPENNSVTDTMQSMVDQGAEVIFATSYGYMSYAADFAKANPEVTVLHQGGLWEEAFPENFGTYWSYPYELFGLGGIAAGDATESNKLGFIYAFPISQTIGNVNAFHLGAQKTNPDVETYLINTSDWCDPVKQQDAVSALVSQGVDVLSQHQDCQSTVIQSAVQAGAKVVGYHHDASDIAGEAWLTGSSWNWAPVFEDIVTTVQAGEFAGSQYNDNWLGSLADNNSTMTLAEFGPSVSDETKAKIEDGLQGLKDGTESVFAGPIYCQDGSVLVAEGHSATYADVNGFNCLVEGIVGSLPSN